MLGAHVPSQPPIRTAAPSRRPLRAVPVATLAIVCGAALAGCPSRDRAPAPAGSATATSATSGNASASCPARVASAALLPGTSAAQAALAYWLARYSPSELDAALLDEAAVADYNATIGKRPGHAVYSQQDLSVAVDPLVLANDVRERLRQLLPQLTRGELVDRSGHALPQTALAAFSEPLPALSPSLRVVLAPVTLRCGPYEAALFKPPIEPSYDKNACGTLHDQELIELLGRTSGGMLLARSRYSLGWLDGNAALSPAVPAALVESFVHGPRLRLLHAQRLGVRSPLQLPKHTTLPVPADGGVLLASAAGFEHAPRPTDSQPTARTLTRRALLEVAFSLADSAYGLGGANAGRDCSGLLLDVFDAFDIALPRYSGWQAETGSYTVDLSGASEQEKLRALVLAGRAGAVLIYFPGHIMLYLGQNERGMPMALHALGEYATPCPGGGESVVDVQRTVVSDLEPGRGSSRKSFVERMTRLVVFGAQPPEALRPALGGRPAPPPVAPLAGTACNDGDDARLFVSPQIALRDGMVRAIAVSSRPLGTATLRIFDSEHAMVPIDLQQLGGSGPPQALVARMDHPRAGRYTAVLGSGSELVACKRFTVHDAPLAMPTSAPDALIWEPHWRWQRDTEGLWSAFIEQLFAGPPDDEQTWTNLHALLADPARNLLYDYLGLHEDDALSIAPDCADLPYALRAYFSWKLKLPFGFRSCSRGRDHEPPTCGDLRTTLEPRQKANEVDNFADYVNRVVRNGVHSATGRTAPDDSATDLYPVALERASLPPGSVYADPYGHVMMLSKWFAQGTAGDAHYGVLMAAEAQPDGTIGRRRFWQGSFLFDPSTENVGAGFKHFRPLEYDRKTHTLLAPDNAALHSGAELPAWSTQQYRGSREDFYDRMDELINPQPLDPTERLHSLIDALEEAVRRRVLAVDNGERYAHGHPRGAIEMPVGRTIFETEGAWEDYATPSRDMRLLIAIDTVIELPARVARKPERFALPPGTNPEQASTALAAEQDRELRARSVTYTRSDGQPQTLSLRQVVDRAAALELAYNPNDCVERRWGAPAASAEAGSCKRNAPPEQRTRMQSYRVWFHTRQRPTRGP